jgi:hypothetical protein
MRRNRWGTVERCIGDRIEETGDALSVYHGRQCNLSVQKSDIVNYWRQERRVTKPGEERIRAARSGVSKPCSFVS